jgi:hypothetical protein
MAERLYNSDSGERTQAPPVHEPFGATASELRPEEIIKRLRALPERQGRLIEMVDAIRKTNAR